MKKDMLLIEQAKKYGQQCSLLFNEFAYWLLEQAQILNIDTLYFFTREGAFFYELVKILKEQLDIQTPQLKILNVSRLSTFLPAVNMQSINPFERLWNVYPNQSGEMFFRSIGINDPQLKVLFEKYVHYKYSQVIKNIHKNSYFQGLIRQENVKEIINAKLKEHKTLLIQYLQQEGFIQDGKQAVVDIGWRGSIQDNLSILFPQGKMHGFYLGLHAFRDCTLMSNKYKNAFLFNGNIKKHRIFASLMRFVLPLEILCTPANIGSTIKYKLQKNNVIPLVKHSSIKEKTLTYKIITTFQRAVLDNVHSDSHNSVSYQTKKCRQIAKQIIWNPKEFLIYVYRNNRFNETFGQGKTHCPYNSAKTLRSIFSNAKRSGWISGYFYKKIPTCLLPSLVVFYYLYCLLTFDNYLIPKQ
jgi:hypothetical protein